MLNILLVLFFLVSFLIFLLMLSFYGKRLKRSVTKTFSFFTSFVFLKEQEFNPDINTYDWDLHKIRLEKFRRSQYKGLTFFMSTDDRIYYLSEKGNKVYC